MEFCEKCGGMLTIKNNKAVCTSCGHKAKKKPKIKVAEKVKQKESISVIQEKDSSTHPIIDIKCTKCKNKKAFFWTMQTRASDESETKFYKCTKCNHTWRVYK